MCRSVADRFRACGKEQTRLPVPLRQSAFCLPCYAPEWGIRMKAYLILEDGTVFEGISIGADKEVISEIVFNTSMAGYLEVLTDPSYAGQAVVMTYPLIGNYGICLEDMESKQAWPDGYIV